MDEVLAGVPGWGLFVVALVYVVLGFYEKARGRLSKAPPPMSATSSGEANLSAEGMELAIRDLQERQQVLEHLVGHGHLLKQLAETGVQQTAILERLSTDVRLIPCQSPPATIPIRRVNGVDS